MAYNVSNSCRAVKRVEDDARPPTPAVCAAGTEVGEVRAICDRCQQPLIEIDRYREWLNVRSHEEAIADFPRDRLQHSGKSIFRHAKDAIELKFSPLGWQRRVGVGRRGEE